MGRKNNSVFAGIALGVLSSILPSFAQLPRVKNADAPVLEQQASDLYSTLRPVVSLAAKSTVEVRVWRNRVAYGTVVGKDRILTKWSEIRGDLMSLSCRTGDGRWLPAELIGLYRDVDLALIQVKGLDATPVIFAKEETLQPGSFLVQVRPDAEAGAMGVVSVAPRSLRADDRGFLGVSMDLTHEGGGVKVIRVEEGTGAARAGLLAGDLILEVNGREADGSFELRSALQRVKPGADVTLKFRRGDEEVEAVTQLGSRPIPQRISEDRMARMNNLGGHVYNLVKDNFANVIQSDMQIQPEDCGAPVVGLDGAVVGISLARAGRIKSYVIPTSTITELMLTEPDKPTSRELAGKPSRETMRLRRLLRANGENDSPDALREHIEELRRLMEEVEEIGP